MGRQAPTELRRHHSGQKPSKANPFEAHEDSWAWAARRLQSLGGTAGSMPYTVYARAET